MGVVASDIKGDGDEIYDELDEQWFAFCQTTAKEIAVQHAQKPDEVKDGEIDAYATFIDRAFHNVAIQRLRKTTQFTAARANSYMKEGRIEKAIEELQELTALKQVLEIYGATIHET